METIETASLISVSDASRLGVSALLRKAEEGRVWVQPVEKLPKTCNKVREAPYSIARTGQNWANPDKWSA